MGKRKRFKLPLLLIFDLIGALIGTLKDSVDAMNPESDGGVRITKAEKDEIIADLTERMREVITRHIEKL